MRRHDLEALEFPHVLSRLADFTQSVAGAALCRALRPQTKCADVAAGLEQAWQCLRVLESEGELPGAAVPDVGANLVRACRDGFVLDGVHLVEIGTVLAAGRRLKGFIRRRRDQLPSLGDLGQRFHALGELEEVLGRALEADGTVRDDASEELSALRQSLRQLRARLTQRLEALVARHTLADVIAERYVTIRNNRLVVPVRANYEQKLQGIVQDRSTSGETVFLEPLFAVELNNALLMTKREEERVVRRILADLTAVVRRYAAEVAETFAAVTMFDVLAAKARFARQYGCTPPELSTGTIDLRQARHPVLLFTDSAVVPVDIRLPPDKQVLVVTGPNTGGKTVALKTVGLLSLMAQTGLLIPAAEGSTLPCWEGVYADVGDEQNIQRNLSTYSAHIANLVDIQQRLAPPALVLLDEPGVGTDPEEGAALAVGLLQTLARPGVRIMASTHYTPVKLHCLTSDACVVAAVDFDRATLTPKYRLLYDSLGESLALPVAERMGLAPAALAAASAARSEAGKKIHAALAGLEDMRRRYEARLGALGAREGGLARREEGLAAREAEAESLLRELRERRREKWRQELATAREFVREVRAEGKRLLARLERDNASRHELEEFAARSAAAISAHEREIAESHRSLAVLQPGDTVELDSGGFRGELVRVSGERAWVRRGTMRVEVPARQLRLVSGAPRPAREAAVHVPDAGSVPAEITLVGLRAKEALAQLETFLDRAALAGHASVRVIHGIGSGALRRAVREYLEVSPYCGSYRTAENSKGGPGVTVVELGR